MGHAPVGFVVSGKPRVQGSKSRETWKDEVRRAAPCRDDWLEGPLYLRVDYFFNSETDLDLDNMIKPIQDALKNCIYEDDKTIHEIHARKFNRNDYDLTQFDFDGAASGVQTVPDQPEEFVFVTVAQLPKGPTGDPYARLAIRNPHLVGEACASGGEGRPGMRRRNPWGDPSPVRRT